MVLLNNSDIKQTSNSPVVSVSMTLSNPSNGTKAPELISNGYSTYRVKDRQRASHVNSNNNNNQSMLNDVTTLDGGHDQPSGGENVKLSKEERIRLVREKREQELLKRKREIEENLKRKTELREKQIQERKRRIDEQKHKENEKRTAAVARRKKREELARVCVCVLI